MKQVGIYVRTFPRVSEAFITEQAQNLARYQPTFIANTLLKETSFSHVSLCRGDFLRVRQTAHILTRSPRLFSKYWPTLGQLSLIHAHFGPDGVYAMALAEKLKLPFLVTFHGYDITISRKAVWRTGKLLYYQLILNETKLKAKASTFIAVSQFIRKKLLEKGYPEEKVVQHYIGVDTNRFSPLKARKATLASVTFSALADIPRRKELIHCYEPFLV